MAEESRANFESLVQNPPKHIVSDKLLLREQAALCLTDAYYLGMEVIGLSRDEFPAPENEVRPMYEWLDRPRPPSLGPKQVQLDFWASPRFTRKTYGMAVWNLQQIIREPNTRIIIDGQERQSAGDTVKLMREWLELPELVRLFGNFQSDDWGKFEFTVAQRDRALRDPTVRALGLDNSEQGKRCDIRWWDDLIGKSNNNPEGILKVEQHISAGMPIIKPGGRGIYGCTRWNPLDPSTEGFTISGNMGILRHVKETGRWFAPPPRGWFGAYAQVGDEIFYPHAKPGALLYPSVLSEDFLEEKRQTMTHAEFACNPAEAPILMTDFSEKPISEIREGDEIVGFDPGQGSTKGILRKVRVEVVGSRTAHVVKVFLASGKMIRCTPDHKWFMRHRASEGIAIYKPPYVGAKLRGIPRPYTHGSAADWAYLSGMIDGEGSVRRGSIVITQSYEKNPDVCRRLEEVLKRLELSYEVAKYADHARMYVLHGGKALKIGLLRHGYLGKSQHLINNVWSKPGKGLSFQDKIVDIKYDREETVYSLQTESGNYVCWGYGSQNSQYLNNPYASLERPFHEEDIQHFDPVVDGERNPLLIGAIPYVAVDPASCRLKTATKDDSTFCKAYIKWQENTFHVFVTDWLGGRWETSRVYDTIFMLNENPPARKLYLEANVGEEFFLNPLRNMARDRGIYLPFEDFHQSLHGTGKKDQRIEQTLQPVYHQKRIWHARHLKNTKAEDQLLRWIPGGAGHDDYPDVLATLVFWATKQRHAVAGAGRPGRRVMGLGAPSRYETTGV